MRPIPKHWQGISYFIGAMMSFSVMNVLIRDMAGTLHPMQMVFIRNFFSFLLLLPFAHHHGLKALKTARPGRHLLRSSVGLIAMESWFFSLYYMPVNTATAISFSAPLFSTVFAVLLLRERIGWMRVTALLIGFGGILIIVNPGSPENWNRFGLLVLFATAMMAMAGIIVKTLTATEPSWRIVFYMTLLMSLMSLPLALSVWQTPSGPQLAQLVGIGVFSTIAQMCLAQGFQREPVVVLMPFEFMRLIFTASLAWLMLGEPLTLSTALGSVIIVSSSAFITWRESLRHKRHVPAEEAL